MKKLISLFLVTTVLLMCLSVPAMAESEAHLLRIGELSYLNADDDSRTALMENMRAFLAAAGAGNLFDNADSLQMKEYDNLNAMQMGLSAGEIDAMLVPTAVGGMLAYFNPDSYYLAFSDRNGNENTEAATDFSNPYILLLHLANDSVFGTDFSFLMTAENTALKEAFDGAISAMKEDGTLSALMDQIYSEAISAVEMPVIDGAETIRVAVTGDLPPYDYIEASGKPAGFNTAILAEISKRIGKQFELVSIESAARAVALSSGSADVVFWTRVSSPDASQYGVDMDSEEIQTIYDGIIEQTATLRDPSMDVPDGTILTVPYLHEMLILVFPAK